MRQRFSDAFSWYSVNINKILFYTCSITLLVLIIERLGIIFSYEGHTAGIDNNFDYPVIRSLAGYSIYPNPSKYPYVVNPYAPLFFIVCKGIASWLHITAAETINVYRVSRSVALIADGGTGIFLFLILKKLIKATRLVSLSAVALFFCIICFLGYTINRADSLFLFFYSSTLFFLVKRTFKNSLLQPLITAIVVTLCIYSKQNGIILMLLVPVWFLQEKNYRFFVLFLFFAILFCSGLFIYFEYHYTGHFFSAHVINSLKNKIDPRWFYVYVFKLIAGSYLTLPLAVALVISVKSIAGYEHSLLKKLSVLFILQLLFSTALCFKWGSSQGYYNESFLSGFVIMVVFFAGNSHSKWTASIKTASIYIYPALLLFVFNVTAQLYFFFLNDPEKIRNRFTEQLQISNYIKKEIGTQNRFVVDISDPDFNFFKNLLYRKCAAPNSDAVNCCTLPDKIFDYSELISGLKTGRIIFLIGKKDNPSAMLWGMDITHFKKDTTFSSYSIYKYDSSKLKP